MNGLRSQQDGGSVSVSSLADSSDHRWQFWNWDAWVLRAAQVVASGVVCYAFRPFALQALPVASAGILIALTVLLAEARVRHAETGEVIGGAAGTLLGLDTCTGVNVPARSFAALSLFLRAC